MARHACRPLAQAGFTLLEILVVLAFVGILVSMAATGLRVFNFGRSPEQQANRVAALLQLASDEAILTGTEVGLRIDSNRLQFSRFQLETREWISLAKDSQFRDREIPDGIVMQLELDGVAVNEIAFAANNESDKVSPAPQIIFFSSGEVVPFTLRFKGETDQPTWQIASNILGQLTVAEKP
ncbi:MAG: type II secretion system minor pseudopilin GspH [Gammaproteobacteria bacterium]